MAGEAVGNEGRAEGTGRSKENIGWLAEGAGKMSGIVNIPG